MPIKIAYGSSAAAAAGGSQLNLNLGADIDLTDGSWTLLDPDNLIKSNTFSAKYNTITWNVLSSGSNNYSWTAGSVHRAPRWYKTFEIDETTISSNDLVNLQIMIQIDTSVDDYSQSLVMGACKDPTSTSASSFLGGGALAQKIASSNDVYGVWTNSSGSTGGSAAALKGFISYIYGPQTTGSGSSLILNSSNLRNANASRNGGLTVSASTNLSLVVGVGTRGNATIAQDDQQKFRLNFLGSTIVIPV